MTYLDNKWPICKNKPVNDYGNNVVLNKAFLRIDIFRAQMDNMLQDNLSEYLLSTLSNMLGLHYAADEKLQKVEQDIAKYAKNIAKRVSDFLGEEVLLEETFDMAMNLFIVALSPTTPPREEPPSLKNNKEVVVNSVGNFCFGDNVVDPSERKNLSRAIDNVIDSKNASEMINVISDHPNLLRGMVQKNIPDEQIKENMTKFAASNVKQNSILSDYAMFAGIAVCGAIGLGAGMLASAYIGAVASVSVVPAAAIALKFGTKLGEDVGEKLASLEKDFRIHSKKLSSMIGDFIPTIQSKEMNSLKPHERGQKQYQDLSKEKIHEIEGGNKDLGDMMKELSAHISSKKDIEQAKDIKIEKTQSQELEKK